MSTLLQQLQSLGGGSANAEKPYRKQPSFVFDDKTAATISLEQFRDIGLKGLHGLIQLNKSFSSYQNTLFAESFMKADREVASKEFNDAVSESIRIFLTLLSPYFLHTHAHYCLEYLLQVFRVHEYNSDALFQCVLPFHEHVLFVRMIQIIPLNKIPLWSFLQANVQSGAPLTRDLLVDKAVINSNVLIVASHIVSDAADNMVLSNTILSFWTIIVTNLIARKNMSEGHLKIIVSMVHEGLTSGHEDWMSSSILIITSLVNHINMTETLIVDVAKVLCVSIRSFHEGEQNVEHVQDAFPTLKLLFNTLTYLLGHVKLKSSEFSDELRNAWWITVPWVTSSGLNKLLIDYLSHDLRMKPYAFGLFSRTIERMLSPSMFTNGAIVDVVEALIRANIVEVSSTVAIGDSFFSTICRVCIANLSSFSKENESTHLFHEQKAFSLLKALWDISYGAVDHRLRILAKENSEFDGIRCSLLKALSESKVSQRPVNGEGLDATAFGKSFHAGAYETETPQMRLLSAFGSSISNESVPTDKSHILSVLEGQRESVEHILSCTAAVDVHWNSLATFLSTKQSNHIREILGLRRNKDNNETVDAECLLQACGIFALVNAENSPLTHHQDSLTRFRNACTALLVTHALRNLGGKNEICTLSNYFSANNLEFVELLLSQTRDAAEIARLWYPSLFQAVEAALKSDFRSSFEHLISIDEAAACFFLCEMIQRAREKNLLGSCHEPSEWLEVFLEHFSQYTDAHEPSFPMSSLSTEKWESLLLCAPADETLRAAIYSFSDTFRTEQTGEWGSFLCLFTLMEMLKSQAPLLLTSTSALRLHPILARRAQSDRNASFLECVLRETLAANPGAAHVSTFIDGVFMHPINIKHLQSILQEFMSFGIAHAKSLSAEACERFSLLFCIGIHRLFRLEGSLCGILQPLDETLAKPDAQEDKSRSFFECIKVFATFVEKGKDLNGASSWTAEEKQSLLPIAEKFFNSIIRHISFVGDDVQRSILIRNFYAISAAFIDMFANERSVANFLASTRKEDRCRPSFYASFADAIAQLQQATVPSGVPRELIFHRVLSASYTSLDEITSVVRSVRDFVASANSLTSRQQSQAIPSDAQEYTEIDSGDVALLTTHMVLQKGDFTSLSPGLREELLDLVLPIRFERKNDSQTCGQARPISFTLEDLWKMHPNKLLTLCQSRFETALTDSADRQVAVQVLHIVQLGISVIERKETTQNEEIKLHGIDEPSLDSLGKLLHTDLQRISSQLKEAKESSDNDGSEVVLSYCAEIEISILQDLKMVTDDVQKLLWDFFIENTSSRRLERRSLDLLQQKWTESSAAAKIDSFDLMHSLGIDSKNRESIDMSALLTRSPQSNVAAFNEILQLLGQLLRSAAEEENQHLESLTTAFLTTVLRPGCLPHPMDSVVCLVVLSFLQEKNKLLSLLPAVKGFFLRSSREHLCMHLSRVLQFGEDLREDEPSKKKHCTGSQKHFDDFTEYLVRFGIDLLDTFAREGRQWTKGQQPALGEAELSFLMVICGGGNLSEFTMDSLRPYACVLFSLDELAMSCAPILQQNDVILPILCTLLQDAVKVNWSQSLADKPLLSCIKQLTDKMPCIDKEKHIGKNHTRKISSYCTIVQTISALLSTNHGQITSPPFAGDKAKNKVLPYFVEYIETLLQLHDRETHGVRQEEVNIKIIEGLDCFTAYFLANPINWKIARINKFCSTLFGPKLLRIATGSETVSSALYLVLQKVFSADKVLVGTLSTIGIYTSVLRALACCVVQRSRSPTGGCDLDGFHGILKEIDVALLSRALTSLCDEYIQSNSSEETIVAESIDVLTSACQILEFSLRAFRDRSTTVTNVRRAAEKASENLYLCMTKVLQHESSRLASLGTPQFNFIQKSLECFSSAVLTGMSVGKKSGNDSFLTHLLRVIDLDRFIDIELQATDGGLRSIDQFAYVSFVTVALCNRMLHEFEQNAIVYMAHFENLLKWLSFVQRINKSYDIYQLLLQRMKNESIRGAQGEVTFHAADLTIALISESIYIASDCIEQLAAHEAGQKWTQSTGVEDGDSLVVLLSRLMCNPLWQKCETVCSGSPYIFGTKHMSKKFDEGAGAVIGSALERISACQGDDMIKTWKSIQEALLEQSHNQAIADIVKESRLRARLSTSIRCQAMTAVEHIYKIVGAPMGILLRDALAHFAKLLEDVNPVIKSFSQKTLHSIVEATGQSIDAVFAAL